MTDTNIGASLAALKETYASSDVPIPSTPIPKVAGVNPEAAAEYKQYTSSKISTCLFTPTGKRINFTNYEYYTKDPEIMEYLDYEIANGLIGFKAGKMVKAEDINPMAALKRRHIEEFLASQEGRDYSSGTLSAAELMKKSAMLSSSGVAAAGEVSSSGSAK